MQPESYQSHAKLEETHWWFVARRAIITQLLHRIVRPCKQSTIVDVGCGTGANLALLCREYRGIGLDTSPHAIQLAQSRFPDVEFIQCDAPLPPASIVEQADVCLMMDVLEHVPDDFLMISSTLSAMRPHTHLIATVPANPHLWSPHDVYFGHYRRYTPFRFQQIWQSLPVTVRLCSSFNTRLYPLIWLIRKLQPTPQHAHSDLRLPSTPVNALLQRIFASESKALLSALDHTQPPPFSSGLSLIAILRREPGQIEPRTRPFHIEPDRR